MINKRLCLRNRVQIPSCAATVIARKLAISYPEQESMSITEQQLISFSLTWRGKPIPQIAEEIASLSMETRKIPDFYFFEYDHEGKLLSPQTGRRVEASISRDSPLDKLEYEGFLLIEQLGWKNDKGIIIWFSPPHPERSHDTKIILIEIESGEQKRLTNRAVRLDMSETDCLQLANRLDQDYVYLSGSELRRRPLFLENFDLENLNDQRQIEMIRQGKDIRAKKEAIVVGNILAENLSILPQVQNQSSIFGKFEISCPPSAAFETFWRNSKVLEQKRILCCTCPFCNEKVEAEIYAGKIHCPNCKKEAVWVD